MTWLVTGGAGYIGLHVVRALRAGGQDAVVLDDLSSGRAELVDVPLVRGSVHDAALLRATMRDHDVRGVIHLAAKKQVGESVEHPLYYYRENVSGLMTLLEVMGECGVDVLVFSSSAAVYGMPDVEFVTEQTPTLPLSPYGETKLVGEWLTRDAAVASGVRYALLRYFNVAGAAVPELSDTGVANLIPMVFQRLSAGQQPLLFGDDYPTPDGSCVRDFIHVADLAEAHVAALAHLSGGGGNLLLNVGRGEGSSVREVLDVVGSVTGLPVDPEIRPRRAGDPARVVASNAAIRSALGWEARHDLRDMVTSAWAGWQLGVPATR
ncbi:MAG TPA: UDP-glucose 4-epimerase GalE [Blastococcus sp.]|jgi:UDP-glucose 4-epimerase|nr:UDP-glucose 4-epimerase GalE [Blastococcus sp.]